MHEVRGYNAQMRLRIWQFWREVCSIFIDFDNFSGLIHRLWPIPTPALPGRSQRHLELIRLGSWRPLGTPELARQLETKRVLIAFMISTQHVIIVGQLSAHNSLNSILCSNLTS